MYDRDALLAAVDLAQPSPTSCSAATPGADRTRRGPARTRNHAQTGRTPPVTVFTSHRGEQRWRCHGCGDGGTAIDLVMACARRRAGTAFDELAERAGESSGRRSLDAAAPRPPSAGGRLPRSRGA